MDELKSKTATLTSENRELTSALMSCQDELSHMNEKLLLTEDSNIKLKTKLEELAAETGQLLTKTPTMKSDLEQVLGKIKQLLDVQKDHEKSLAEHDLSRFGDKSTGKILRFFCILFQLSFVKFPNFVHFILIVSFYDFV